MRRLWWFLLLPVTLVAGVVVSAQTERAVEHPTLAPGQSLEDLAAALCPGNPAAALADLNESNPPGGSVKHYHPDVCTGVVTTTEASTTTVATTLPPSTTVSTTSTTQPGSTTTAVPPTTVPPTTVPPTTVPPTTSPPSTTTTAPGTTSPTTSTSTTTTTVAPTTTTGGGGGGETAFTAQFATPSDFIGRFRTYVGNACSADQSCRPCVNFFGAICQFPGDHDMNCGAPTTTRTVHVANHSELFWWCAPNGPDTGHVMIGMNTSGYAISAFTPTQTFTNITSICWDQNLTDLGGGKWMVLTLVPGAVFGGRLDYTLPEFDADNGPGDFNLQRQSRWQFKLFRNQLRIFDRLGQAANPLPHASDWGVDSGYVAGSDRATRYRVCLTENVNGYIVVSQQRPGGTTAWSTVVVDSADPGTEPDIGARFPDGPVTVIWADDTYDADKHGGTGLYTWHFDNIEIRTS